MCFMEREMLLVSGGGDSGCGCGCGSGSVSDITAARQQS